MDDPGTDGGYRRSKLDIGFAKMDAQKVDSPDFDRLVLMVGMKPGLTMTLIQKYGRFAFHEAVKKIVVNLANSVT